MNRPAFVLFGVALLLAAAVAALVLAIGDPLRDNTIYAKPFSKADIDRITIGMPRAAVIELLGEPLGSGKGNSSVDYYTDERVRERYGRKNTIEVETAYFTDAIDPHRDFESFHVEFGPDGAVVKKDRWP